MQCTRALGLGCNRPWPMACYTACTQRCPTAAMHTIRPLGLCYRGAWRTATVVGSRSSRSLGPQAGGPDPRAQLEADFYQLVDQTTKANVRLLLETNKNTLLQNGITDADALRAVTKEGLVDLGVLSAHADILKSEFPNPGASGQGASGQGDAGKVYSNITLYILGQGQQGYEKLERKKATRNQLQRMWEKFSYDLVTRVKSQPAQLLTPATCPDAADMGSMELEDGAHLALVVHQPLNFMGQLVDRINKNTEKDEELQGFIDNSVSEQENAAAAWALKELKAEPGAQIFCFNKLSQKIGRKIVNAVQLDGVACSDISCNIVERKQQFRHKEVLELIATINTLKILIDNKAPNTDLLQRKELRFFMMAGSWPTDDTDEQAAVRELMMQHRIQPVMPDGSGYHISWGCNLQTPDQAKRVQNFKDKMGRVKQPKPAALQR